VISLTLLLLAANVVVYLMTVGPDGVLRPEVAWTYGLYAANLAHRPSCLITYMFLHAGPVHLLFNLLGLLTFGLQLERLLSPVEYLLLYFASGVAGGLLQVAVTPDVPVVGASSAIFGLLGCLTMLRPMSVIMFFLVPMPLVLFSVLYALAAVLVIESGKFTNVAHAGHLGGMIVGGGLALLYRPREALRGLVAVTVVLVLLLVGYRMIVGSP